MRTKQGVLILFAILCVWQTVIAAEEEVARPIPAWPLVWHRSDKDLVETDLLFSLIHYEREKNRSAFSFRPYLYWTEKDLDRDYYKVSALFRLFNYEREGARSSFYLAPLYWNWTDATTLHTINLIPPYYHYRTPGEDTMHAWPFYSRIEKGSYREWGGLYPLIRFGRDPQNNVELDQFLLYYRKQQQDRSFTTFFPVYFGRQEGRERSTWVLPLYYSRSDDTTLRTVNLIPPYYHNKEPGEETLHVWPFYSEIEKGSYREYGFLYPLFRHGRDPEKQYEFDYYLLYYRKQEEGRTFTTFFPLWWHKDAGTATTDAIPFLHWYEHDRESGSKDLSLFWIVPPQLSLFRYTREGTTVHHRFFPLYSYTSDEERHVSNWSILWFLFSYESEGEFSSQSGFLWKVITFERKDAENYDFRFLWRFIRKSRTPTLSTVEFNPIFYSEEDAEKGSYWAILGGLIGRETLPDGRTRMRFLWVF